MLEINDDKMLKNIYHEYSSYSFLRKQNKIYWNKKPINTASVTKSWVYKCQKIFVHPGKIKVQHTTATI